MLYPLIAALGMMALAAGPNTFPDLSLEELMGIETVTAAKRSQSVAEAPAHIIVITRELIELRGYRNLRDVLEDLPGVEVQRNSSPEYQDYYTIRGVSGNEKFIVLHDGFRMGAPTGTPHPIGHNFALTNVKRIEIMFGPGSALYGADAFSGVVNIVSVPGEEVGGLFADASYGLFGTTDASLVYGATYGDFSWAATASHYQSKGFRFVDDAAYGVESSWYLNHYARDGAMRGTLGEGGDVVNTGTPLPFESPSSAYLVSYRVNAGNYELGWFRNSETHSSSLGLDPAYAIYSRDASLEMMLDSLYLSHFYDSGEQGWSIRWVLGYGTYELKPNSQFRNVMTGYQPGYKYAWGQRTHFEEQIDWVLTDWLLMSVGGSTDVISAIPKTGDLPRPYDPSLSAELQDLEYLGTDVVTADGEALNSEQDVYTINDQNLGLYGEAHIELDDWLSLTAGARYDSSTRYGGSINPRAVLVASSDDGLQVKALYGEAYLSPSPYKSYQHFGSFSATRDETGAVTGLVGGTWHLPNPDLAPEKIRTGELSVVWRWSERLRVDLDGFASRLDNLIEIRDQGPGTFKGVPVESVERAENVSRGEVYGVTLRAEGRLRLGALSLRPHGSYAWIDGQMGGEALSYTAEHSIKAGVDFVWRDTSVSAMLRYASKSEHARVTQEDGDRVSVDGGIASRLFVRQRFQLGESLPVSLWLRVDNVLDRRGWDLSYAGAEGLARVPHEPLRAQLGLSIGALDL